MDTTERVSVEDGAIEDRAP